MRKIPAIHKCPSYYKLEKNRPNGVFLKFMMGDGKDATHDFYRCTRCSHIISFKKPGQPRAGD